MKREDIINKRFDRAFWGYDIRQVDAFLDELISMLDSYEKGRELDMVRIKTLITELERRTAAGRTEAGRTQNTAPKPAAPQPAAQQPAAVDPTETQGK